ncbi:hypothetical protein 20Sep418_00038 [Pseudomonas phage 20Sep418]|uniref:Uncharacterized protein n=1 Tax=Pseudomonas phage Baskent_P3_3B TaxID=3145033 RepID=A0AAU8BBH9_9CAUD|nr:hypothetical protein 9081_00098 [Pseudomonas phage bmx-p3]WFG37717.1 hypothetical protein 20Sep418_00038 [Pseudomonas phage 20Sep418]
MVRVRVPTRSLKAGLWRPSSERARGLTKVALLSDLPGAIKVIMKGVDKQEIHDNIGT